MSKSRKPVLFTVILFVQLLSTVPAEYLASAQSSKAPIQQWEQDYTIPTSVYDAVNCLVQTTDGGYAFAATLTRGIATNAVLTTLLVKTNSSGGEEWEKQFGFYGALGLVQTSDGFVLAGHDNDSTGTALF